jgi:hypothetical protein
MMRSETKADGSGAAVAAPLELPPPAAAPKLARQVL